MRARALVLALVCLVSCRKPPSPRFVAVPPGAGAEVPLGVAGATNAEPSVAARWPFVALAWTVTTGRDAVIYVATSVDNGASFSPPLPLEMSRTPDARLTPHVILGSSTLGADGELAAPALHVVWQTAPRAGGGMRAAKSVDAGRSFVGEAVDRDRPVDLPPERVPSADQLTRAVEDAAPSRVRGTYDECGTLLVVWDGGGGGRPGVIMRRLIQGPDRVPHVLSTETVSSEASLARAPAVASLLGGVLVAYVGGTPAASSIVLRRVGLESICQVQTATRGRPDDAATP